MRKVKSLEFKQSDWSSTAWCAETPFCWYVISRYPDRKYKQGFGYSLSLPTGRVPLQKYFEDTVKLAQIDWENRLSKIEDCYENDI